MNFRITIIIFIFANIALRPMHCKSIYFGNLTTFQKSLPLDTSITDLELSFSNQNIDDNRALIIANGISPLLNTASFVIDSQNNSLSDTAAKYLASGYENFKLLTVFHLNLDNNNISDIGAQYLAAGYQHFYQLHDFNLRMNQNNIGETGAYSLAIALKDLSQLQFVYLNTSYQSQTYAISLSIIINPMYQRLKDQKKSNQFQYYGDQQCDVVVETCGPICLDDQSICIPEQCTAPLQLNIYNFCDPCHDTCQTCSIAQDATKCITCIDGTINLSGTQQCLPCPSNCKTCDSQYSCKSCNEGYNLNQGGVNIFTCDAQPCNSHCMTCDQYGKCLSCDAGYYLDRYVCLIKQQIEPIKDNTNFFNNNQPINNIKPVSNTEPVNESNIEPDNIEPVSNTEPVQNNAEPVNNNKTAILIVAILGGTLALALIIILCYCFRYYRHKNSNNKSMQVNAQQVQIQTQSNNPSGQELIQIADQIKREFQLSVDSNINIEVQQNTKCKINSKNEIEADICPICLDRKKKFLIWPCRHRICEDPFCRQSVVIGKPCPVCKTVIEQLKTSYQNINNVY